MGRDSEPAPFFHCPDVCIAAPPRGAVGGRYQVAAWITADFPCVLITTSCALTRLVATTVKSFGRLDGAFNNAGVVGTGGALKPEAVRADVLY
jgi:NAD(P)-dependent dehydrogenase (short-subunit alcohol dehydrogenase family)